MMPASDPAHLSIKNDLGTAPALLRVQHLDPETERWIEPVHEDLLMVVSVWGPARPRAGSSDRLPARDGTARHIRSDRPSVRSIAVSLFEHLCRGDDSGGCALAPGSPDHRVPQGAAHREGGPRTDERGPSRFVEHVLTTADIGRLSPNGERSLPTLDKDPGDPSPGRARRRPSSAAQPDTRASGRPELIRERSAEVRDHVDDRHLGLSLTGSTGRAPPGSTGQGGRSMDAC